MLRVAKLNGFWVVDESVQPGGSFKIRGVAQCFRSLGRRNLDRSFVTFTSGNHGIAVALLASQVGQRPVVVVPSWIEMSKRRLLERLGCRLIAGGESATQCETVARQVAEELDGQLLHPFRSGLQIVGYTSLWSEIAQVFPHGADVVVPVGSGGLFAAGILYRAASLARYRVIGVEPEKCASLTQSLSAGRPCRVDTRSEFAASLNVNVTPEEWFDLVAASDDCDLVTVSDREIVLASAIMAAWWEPIDPGAAAAVAFALFRHYRPRSRDLVVIITGRGAAVSAQNLRCLGLLDRDASEFSRVVRPISRSHPVVVPTRREIPHALVARTSRLAREELH